VIFNGRPLSSYSNISYNKENYPALKFFLPLTETSGTDFTDLAGDRVWRPALLGDIDASQVFAVPNAVTAAVPVGGLPGELEGDIYGTPIQGSADKVGIVLCVFGGYSRYGVSTDDYWYMRFGGIDVADPTVFEYNINTTCKQICEPTHIRNPLRHIVSSVQSYLPIPYRN